MDSSPRAFLEELFRTAVAAAHPSTFLQPLLPPPPKGRLILLSAGKAAGSMAEVAEAHYLDRLRIAAERLSGVAVARHGYGRHLRRVRMIEAGHPIPDQAGLEGAERALALADGAGADDLVLVLMSGGASANWIAPADGITFADKQAVTRALLRSGATIGEINTVRKHLSRIKGGRLARHAHPAKLSPSLSPTCRATSRPPSAPARPCPIRLRSPMRAPSSPNTGSTCRRPSPPRSPTRATKRRNPATRSSPTAAFVLAARPADSLRAAEAAVRAAGYDCVSLGDRVEGEAREVAAAHARLARDLRAQGKRAVILSGGELTVTIRGKGRGGPEPGIRPGAGDRARRHAGGGGARRRHRRHRRRHRRGQRPRRRIARRRNRGARQGAWPRSRRVSCRQ